jgi:hydrogenase maturation protein HypF
LRVKINVTGIVQGVGFRPFVYRLAVQNGLAGYVRNRGDAGVEILLEGEEQSIQRFLRDKTHGQKRAPKICHHEKLRRG